METFEFKAEIKEVLDILIHSLYTQKDIFLRELISNASDAIDKLKLHGLINGDAKLLEVPFEIKISTDSPNKKLIISDNGIGMTRQEVLENLGTLAHSGTKKFLEAVKSKQKQEIPELIGQFGVGFYSVYMVADKVEVVTKSAITNETAIKWTSKGDASFSIEEAEKEEFGTDVIVYLKKGEEIYLSRNKIEEIIKKYSDYIEFPIYFINEKKEKIKLNSQVALWRKNKNDITEEEYKNFYRQHSYEAEDPLEVIHYRGEGLIEFTALLFIPAKKPFNIYMKEFEYGPALYINKVLIMNHCQELIPPYLRFLKGIIEAESLPLNVSREFLQNNGQIITIKNNIIKKVIDHLEYLKNNEREKYVNFYKEFGRLLKEGIFYEIDKKEKLASLILAETTKTKNGEFISLDEYLTRMQVAQEYIYFLPGKDVESMRNSPYLEIFKEKDIEVLLLTDDFDDLCMAQLHSYKGKELKSVLSSDISLGKTPGVEENNKDILEFIKDVLKNKVADVKISNRLKDSIGLIVNKSGFLEDTISTVNFLTQIQPRILEININHPIFIKLKTLLKTTPKETLVDYIYMIYNIALMESNYNIDNPLEFKKMLENMIEKSLPNLQTT
jgi:molecular chaperone HtpG